MITAELALEEGREVFCCSRRYFLSFSEGCNNLIKTVRQNLPDVKDNCRIWMENKNNKNSNLDLTSYEEKYFLYLKKKNLDELILESSFKASEILSILMDLEIKHIIVSIPGGKYRRKTKI